MQRAFGRRQTHGHDLTLASKPLIQQKPSRQSRQVS
jgi:hypothetical protein